MRTKRAGRRRRFNRGKSVSGRLLLRAALVAVFAVALISQQAEAANPKEGDYTAKIHKGGVFAHVNKRAIVTYFSGVCYPTHETDLIFSYTAEKHFRVRHGHFDYKGTVFLYDGYSNPSLDAEISGRFTDHGKRWQGKVVVETCETQKFEGTYISG